MAKTTERQAVPDIAPVTVSRLKKAIPVNQYELSGKYIATHKSIQKASDETKTTFSGIVNCLKGKAKTAGGFQWRKAENV